MATGNYLEALKNVKDDFIPRESSEYFSTQDRLYNVFDMIPAWIKIIKKNGGNLVDIPLVKPDPRDRFMQFQGTAVSSDGNTIEIGRDSRKWSDPHTVQSSVLIGFSGDVDGSEKHIQYRIARVGREYSLLLADPDLPTGHWINVKDIMPESYRSHIHLVEELLDVVREKAMHIHGGPATAG